MNKTDFISAIKHIGYVWVSGYIGDKLVYHAVPELTENMIDIKGVNVTMIDPALELDSETESDSETGSKESDKNNSSSSSSS